MTLNAKIGGLWIFFAILTWKSLTLDDLEGHWQPVRSAVLVTAMKVGYLCCLQGMCCAFIGPCLHDFQIQTNTTLSQISRLFVGHAAGSLVGSVVAVYVSVGLGSVAASLVVLAALVAVLPWCTSLPWLLAAFTVQGLSFGTVATSKCYTLSVVFIKLLWYIENRCKFDSLLTKLTSWHVLGSRKGSPHCKNIAAAIQKKWFVQ